MRVYRNGHIPVPRFDTIGGHDREKRALEIALSADLGERGGHSISFFAPQLGLALPLATVAARYGLVVDIVQFCPCGKGGNGCDCAPSTLKKWQEQAEYKKALRADLRIAVSPQPYYRLAAHWSERDEIILERVSQNIKRPTISAALSTEVQKQLSRATKLLSFSSQRVEQVIAVARTIARMSGSSDVELAHLFEAVQYNKKPTVEGLFFTSP